jgi:hypothetical protein
MRISDKNRIEPEKLMPKTKKEKEDEETKTRKAIACKDKSVVMMNQTVERGFG